LRKGPGAEGLDADKTQASAVHLGQADAKHAVLAVAQQPHARQAFERKAEGDAGGRGVPDRGAAGDRIEWVQGWLLRLEPAGRRRREGGQFREMAIVETRDKGAQSLARLGVAAGRAQGDLGPPDQGRDVDAAFHGPHPGEVGVARLQLRLQPDKVAAPGGGVIGRGSRQDGGGQGRAQDLDHREVSLGCEPKP
jgi:hypothetical protein